MTTAIPQRLREIAGDLNKSICREQASMSAEELRAIAAELEAPPTSVVAISPGRYITRGGDMVYIACRCGVRPDGSKNEYPWLVEGGKRSWFVNDTGRHLQSGATEFDVVSRVVTSPPAPGANELEAPAADAVPIVAYRGHPDDPMKPDALVTQRDHIATVAALQARINELESRQWFLSDETDDAQDDVWSAAADAYNKTAGALRGHLEWRDRIRAAVRVLLAGRLP